MLNDNGNISSLFAMSTVQIIGHLPVKHKASSNEHSPKKRPIRLKVC